MILYTSNFFKIVNTFTLHPIGYRSFSGDDFREKYGCERILEALKSHMWSNHTMIGMSTLKNGLIWLNVY